MKSINIKDLKVISSPHLTWISGDSEDVLTTISTPENIEKNSLVFLSHKNHYDKCVTQNPKVVIAHKSLTPHIQNPAFIHFETDSIPAAMSLILPLFATKTDSFEDYISFEKKDSFTFISPHATIGKNAVIGPFTTIQSGVTVGENTFIQSNCFIGKNSQIGSNTTIHSHVSIGSNCHIGNNCEVFSNTTIGADGFGYYTDKNHVHYKIPQLGKVIIEDYVDIGANCCVDKATLTETRIKKGTKMDNHCHIAHNCVVGENSIIAAGFFMAGSSKIGKNFTAGGSVAVSTHLNITDNVTLAGRSGVTNHILEAGQYGGYPLQPLSEALKTISTLGKITEMRKKINLALKKLNIEL